MKKLLPHVCMDLALIFLTLSVLDQINPNMHFLSRNLFKIPLMLFLILVVVLSMETILRQRAEGELEEDGRTAADQNNTESEAKS